MLKNTNKMNMGALCSVSVSLSVYVSVSLSLSLFLVQDVLEGGNLRAPLQELHQMILTPIKSFSSEEPSQHPLLGPEGKAGLTGSHMGGGEVESSTTIISEGDIPGQFTRVMGKGATHTHTQLYTQLHCHAIPLQSQNTNTTSSEPLLDWSD